MRLSESRAFCNFAQRFILLNFINYFDVLGVKYFINQINKIRTDSAEDGLTCGLLMAKLLQVYLRFSIKYQGETKWSTKNQPF